MFAKELFFFTLQVLFTKYICSFDNYIYIVRRLCLERPSPYLSQHKNSRLSIASFKRGGYPDRYHGIVVTVHKSSI